MRITSRNQRRRRGFVPHYQWRLLLKTVVESLMIGFPRETWDALKEPNVSFN
jgi:hypothetical protein